MNKKKKIYPKLLPKRWRMDVHFSLHVDHEGILVKWVASSNINTHIDDFCEYDGGWNLYLASSYTHVYHETCLVNSVW